MAIARAHLIDPAVTGWYHCITRCVRRAFLLGEGADDRKLWIDKRIEELAQIFSIAVAGFSVLDNHLHLLVRLDPDVAAGWSDEEIVRRWGRLFPPRDKSRRAIPVSDDWVQWRLKDTVWVATARARLQSLSWFMKCLKEPLSRLANREEKTHGAFFESRFKSVAILDEEALLATCAYIDLNPVAAGIAATPEASEHTSIKERVEHAKAQGRTEDLKAAGEESVAGSAASAGLEESHWLCPIEDRRGLDSSREGMIEGFSLGSCLNLVDYTGRLFREGKATISQELAGIFERLGTTAKTWCARLEKLSKGRLLGRFLAASRQRLREVAERLGLRRVPNPAGCAASRRVPGVAPAERFWRGAIGVRFAPAIGIIRHRVHTNAMPVLSFPCRQRPSVPGYRWSLAPRRQRPEIGCESVPGCAGTVGTSTSTGRGVAYRPARGGDQTNMGSEHLKHSRSSSGFDHAT
jgi:REP element-mobilizing transposase RayT